MSISMLDYVNVPPGFGPPFEWENNGARFVVYNAGIVLRGDERIVLFAFSSPESPNIFEVLSTEEIDERLGEGAADRIQRASHKPSRW